MVVDGTFIKNSFKQIIMLAIGMDIEDKVIVLAPALVSNECIDTRTWFLI